MDKKGTFSCGTNAGNPERARWPILSDWITNQIAGFASYCPLADSAIIKALLTSSVHETQNSSKFGHQLLVKLNYACAFSQSESGKCFE